MSLNEASSEARNRTVQRVLADLAREDMRTSQLYGKERIHERKPLNIKVDVAPIFKGKMDQNLVQQVWVRNLSRGGISFVSLDQIETNEVGIHLLNGDNGALWMQGQVMRRRPIQEGFWEFGVKFIGSFSPPV